MYLLYLLVRAMLKTHTIWLLLVIQLLLGCSVQQSYITGSHCNSKCTYLRMAVGRAKNISFWGLDGHKKENLVFLAKNNLYRTFPLHKAEFYDNFIVSIRKTYYPFVQKTVVTIHADIVTEDMIDSDRAFSSSYYEYLGHPQTNRWGIELADSVVFLKAGKPRKGVVIELSEHKATVMTMWNGNEQFYTMPIKRLFAIENENLEDACGCEAGEVLEITTVAGNEPKITKIMGLQKDRYLLAVSQKNKTYYRITNIPK